MKLKKRLSFIFVAIALLPFAVGMTIILGRTTRTIQTNALSLLGEYSGGIAANLGVFFAEKKGYVDSYSNIDDIREFNWAKIRPTLMEQTRTNKTFNSFILAKKDGSYYRSDNKGNPAQGGLMTEDNEDPSSAPLSLASDDYFMNAIADGAKKSKKIVLSDPEISRSTDNKQIIIATNIQDNEQSSIGMLGVVVDGSKLETKLLSFTDMLKDSFGTEAVFAVISDTGALISLRTYDFDANLYTEKVLLDPKEYTVETLSPEIVGSIGAIAESGDSSVRYRDAASRKWFRLALKPVPGTNYSVLVIAPEAVLFAAVKDILMTLQVTTACALVIVLLIALLLGRQIAQPLIETARTFKEIAEGSGDLTYRLKLSGRDEITEVCSYYNKFMDTIHGMISLIKTDAGTLDRISGDLKDKSDTIKKDIDKISGNVSDLNAQTDEQSASVTETSSTIHQIAKNIESLSQQIEGQSASVTESSAAIQQMVSNINSISSNLDKAGSGFEDLLGASVTGRETMQNVSELVKNVSTQSENLLETNEIINSIASQTNLLAMNAAIEAAHAGESGKGFSVVSDEIRKLAENTSEQSKVIEGELKKVVSTISTIVEASSQADNAFGVVADRIKEANGLVQEIRLAMKEQTEGSRQVLEALDEIQNITMQIRDGSLEMNQGATMILNEMVRLENISHKVQESTLNIARSSDAIGDTIESITAVAGENSSVVRSMNELTDGFKL